MATINYKDPNSGNWVEISTGGTNITVDSVLSSTSENPVQNKVVTAAINNKVGKTDYASKTSAGVAKIYQDSAGYLCIDLR